MRCPYCGGLNRDQYIYCVNCGRDMRTGARDGAGASVPGAQTSQSVGQSRPPVAQPQRPQAQPPASGNRRQSAPSSRPAASVPQPVVQPPLPEAPGPFPPTSMAQFEALLGAGAQEYTVIESQESTGKKKILRITYPRCAPWQQAATLLKAFKEQQEEQCTIIIIQGNLPNQQESYGYTNGQLEFARRVYLGARIINRYIVETGNGFSSDSTRFVLNT